jgi:tetratricopeptide (TPR) repeat protein
MAESYWWSRYGNFDPGEDILPHMGQVVAHYRKKYGCRTQAEFAIASGFKERTIIEWESSPMIVDQNRRKFLAKMLKIPPALLGLDWRLIYYQDNQGTPAVNVPSEYAADLVNEESYYLYEDALTMAYNVSQGGRLMNIADCFERRLRKLEEIVERAPAIEREAWLGLLCQYYLLEISVVQGRGTSEENKQRCLILNAKALKIAQEIEDQEMTAKFWLNRADIQFEQEHIRQARIAAHKALEASEKIGTHTPLYGNIQLMTTPMLLPETISDSELLKSIRRSQDKVLNIVRDKRVEPDRSFMRISLTGVHHERAKMFLELHKLYPQQGYLKDVNNEMRLAWNSLTPEFATWALYYHLTEAHLYKLQNELEQSAQSGIEALKIIRTENSRRKEGAIAALYHDLRKLDERNPYVCNLGVQLGMF